MEEITLLRNLYGLKKVYRMNSVESRKESSAEHSWSCLILADYFLEKIKKIDKLKVFELLIYHDVIEIEVGDSPLMPGKKDSDKKRREEKSLEILKNKLPKEVGEKYVALFKEFEEEKTREAKFAKAIDQLDAVIHEMDYKKDWNGWTEQFLRNSKSKYFEEFPELKDLFEKLMVHLKKEGYFDQ